MSGPFLAESRANDSGLSRDIHLADAGHRRSLSYVGRQQLKRLLLVFGFDGPPNCVPARAARGDCGLVTERALVALEGCERDAALSCLVAMLEEVAGHALSVRQSGCAPHRGSTLTSHPDFSS